MNQTKTLWSRFTELMENGLNTPDITDEEKVAYEELQQTLTALANGAKPMRDLESPANATDSPFIIELAKFNCRMAFISARTSDEVCKLTGLIRDNNETIEKQFELAKSDMLASQEINKLADRKATRAIKVAIATLVISSIISIVAIIVGIISMRVAHEDSDKTSQDIVKAIEQCMGKSGDNR